MKKVLKILIFCFLVSCVNYNEHYYKLNDNYLTTKQYKTKYFDIGNEDIILSSSIQTLQDLGFIIYESENDLGLLAAYKNTYSDFDKFLKQGIKTKISDTLFSVFQDITFNKQILENDDFEFDMKYKIYANVISTKDKNKIGYNVRVDFYKITWTNLTYNKEYGDKIEPIEDKNVYREFFEKLNHSIFLTTNNL